MNRSSTADESFVPVPPRVLCADSGETRPLLDKLLDLDEAGEHVVVHVTGVGTTTALRFVMSEAGDTRFAAIGPDYVWGEIDICRILLVEEPVKEVDHVLTLASWEIDDFIQYLLLNHPNDVRSVMARIVEAKQADFADGSPAVWRNVLDWMAREPETLSPQAACRGWIEQALGKSADVNSVQLADRFLDLGFDKGMARIRTEQMVPVEVLQVLAPRDVQFLLVAGCVAKRLAKGDPSVLKTRFSKKLLSAIAQQIKDSDSAIDCLQRAFSDDIYSSQAASLLVKSAANWRPPSRPKLNMQSADLCGARWSHCKLLRVDLTRADLSDAMLDEADLVRAELVEASFRRAQLRGAALASAKAILADFSHAELSKSLCTKGDFSIARFVQADLSRAEFAESLFVEADFSRANLAWAKFDNCIMHAAKFEGAVLSHTGFREANLAGVDFRLTAMDDNDFYKADLTSTNFEDIDLGQCNFRAARLWRSLLTGSVARRADFSKAVFLGAGMAEIVWEACDLRDADFSNAAFHMGSTRCGLVGSPYPSHGTRTGFYTDDYEDLSYKQPELIRKAALIDCDLRGANLLATDFYLVDVRGSIFDRECRRHLQKCGAILR